MIFTFRNGQFYTDDGFSAAEVLNTATHLEINNVVKCQKIGKLWYVDQILRDDSYNMQFYFHEPIWGLEALVNNYHNGVVYLNEPDEQLLRNLHKVYGNLQTSNLPGKQGCIDLLNDLWYHFFKVDYKDHGKFNTILDHTQMNSNKILLRQKMVRHENPNLHQIPIDDQPIPIDDQPMRKRKK